MFALVIAVVGSLALLAYMIFGRLCGIGRKLMDHFDRFEARLTKRLASLRYEFTLNLPRSEESSPRLGLDLVPANDSLGGLAVVAVEQGGRLDCGIRSGDAVQVGDRLFNVNGATEVPLMLQELAAKGSLALRFSREAAKAAPKVWEVELDGSRNGSLGLRLESMPRHGVAPALVVGRVMPGDVVDRWNRSAACRTVGAAVRHGDVVVACEPEVQCELIIASLRKAKRVKLTLLRWYAGDGAIPMEVQAPPQVLPLLQSEVEKVGDEDIIDKKANCGGEPCVEDAATSQPSKAAKSAQAGDFANQDAETMETQQQTASGASCSSVVDVDVRPLRKTPEPASASSAAMPCVTPKAQRGRPSQHPKTMHTRGRRQRIGCYCVAAAVGLLALFHSSRCAAYCLAGVAFARVIYDLLQTNGGRKKKDRASRRLNAWCNRRGHFEARLAERLAGIRYEFNMELVRDEGGVKVGLVISPMKDEVGGLLVQEIVPDGLAYRYNASCTAGARSTEAMRPGDRIVGANMQTLAPLMLQEIAADASADRPLCLRVSRDQSRASPKVWSVDLDSKNGSFGLRLSPEPSAHGGSSLVVGRVLLGSAVDRWNRSAKCRAAGNEIYHGDLLVACGNELEEHGILKRFQSETRVQVTLLRWHAATQPRQHASDTSSMQPAPSDAPQASAAQCYGEDTKDATHEAPSRPSQTCACCGVVVGAKYLRTICEAGDTHVFRHTCWRQRHGGFTRKQVPRRCACGSLLQKIQVYSGGGVYPNGYALEDRLLHTIIDAPLADVLEPTPDGMEVVGNKRALEEELPAVSEHMVLGHPSLAQKAQGEGSELQKMIVELPITAATAPSKVEDLPPAIAVPAPTPPQTMQSDLEDPRYLKSGPWQREAARIATSEAAALSVCISEAKLPQSSSSKDIRGEASSVQSSPKPCPPPSDPWHITGSDPCQNSESASSRASAPSQVSSWQWWKPGTASKTKPVLSADLPRNGSAITPAVKTARKKNVSFAPAPNTVRTKRESPETHRISSGTEPKASGVSQNVCFVLDAAATTCVLVAATVAGFRPPLGLLEPGVASTSIVRLPPTQSIDDSDWWSDLWGDYGQAVTQPTPATNQAPPLRSRAVATTSSTASCLASLTYKRPPPPPIPEGYLLSLGAAATPIAIAEKGLSMSFEHSAQALVRPPPGLDLPPPPGLSLEEPAFLSPSAVSEMHKVRRRWSRAQAVDV